MKHFMIQTLKALVGASEYLLRPWNYQPDELLVLCMHSTPLERRDQMEKLVDFLLLHFKSFDPMLLSEYFEGKHKAGPYVLFTFDDGLKNNAMAAEVLESRGARAVFFVVPHFIDAPNPMAYYREHIRKVIDAKVDHETEDFTPMSIAELKGLVARGHSIQSHTMSHLLRATAKESDVEYEVAKSSHWLHENVGVKPQMFCSPIQTNFSISAFAKQRIEATYRYHFTTFPGLNASEKRELLILRRNIEVHWSLAQIKYALGKVDLPRWKGEISRFQQL